MPCWGTVPAGLTAHCGMVAAPENRRKATSPTVRLAVMILRQEGVEPAGAPTFLLGGGPGQDVIALFTGLLASYDKLCTSGYPASPYQGQLRDWLEFRAAMDLLVADLAKRELVLIDQRGAGYSEPSLKCRGEPLDACRDRLVRSGVDLSAYNTRENAADIDAIREALGYEAINLQGGSYGTRLAFRVMRDYPEHLRAVVLDSVLAPQTDWYVEVVARYDETLGLVFDHCAADPACAAAYPQLRREFYELVARLDREPATLPGGGHMHGRDFLGLTWNAMYDIGGIRWLPLIIHHAYQADYSPLATLAAAREDEGAETMAWAMNYAIECAEEWSVGTRDAMLAAGRTLNPAIAQDAVGQFMHMEEVCRLWAVPSERPDADEPVASPIPTLLLSGEFDPATPPAFAKVAASTLSRHYRYVFPAMGHTDAFFSLCWSSVQSQFLDHPEQAPDAGCIAGMPESTFVVD